MCIYIYIYIIQVHITYCYSTVCVYMCVYMYIYTHIIQEGIQFSQKEIALSLIRRRVADAVRRTTKYTHIIQAGLRTVLHVL